MKKSFLYLPIIFSLSACATAPEDLSRRVHFNWDLTPETSSIQSKEIEQGEIFFTWAANAKATHSIMLQGKTRPLVLAKTKYGNLYCTGGMKSDKCYEDRDGDNRFETVWAAEPTSRSPIVAFYAAAPEALETPIQYNVNSAKNTIVATQNLGAVYDGTYRGLLSDDDQFSFMVGAFQIGWHGGKDAPRDPTGLGWVPVNFIAAAYSDKRKLEIFIDKLGLTYAITGAQLDGRITLDVSAQSRKNVAVNEDMEVDLPELEQISDGEDIDNI